MQRCRNGRTAAHLDALCRDFVTERMKQLLSFVLMTVCVDYAVGIDLLGLCDEFLECTRLSKIRFPERCWCCHLPLPCEHEPDKKRYLEGRVLLEIVVACPAEHPDFCKLEIWRRARESEQVSGNEWVVADGTVELKAFRIQNKRRYTTARLIAFLCLRETMPLPRTYNQPPDIQNFPAKKLRSEVAQAFGRFAKTRLHQQA